MKVLGLTKYSRLGASSRLRAYQYEHELSKADIRVDWQPLFDDGYIEDLYVRRTRGRRRVAAAFLQRLGALISARRYDLVWLEKEALPWWPAIADPGFLRLRARYVVDYDDAVYHGYDQSAFGIVRGLLGHKIDAVMRHAVTVIVGNPYLAERAKSAGARRVEQLPTVIDLDKYSIRDAASGTGLRIGWIGSPSTQQMIAQLAPVLKTVLNPESDRLVTVGARFDQLLFPGHEMHEWNEQTEVEEIRQFDIGVMPLVDRPFERGKCGYKLIQYMGCGLPVVASPVGVNCDIVEHGVNGYLASNEQEWFTAISTLRSDPVLRRAMGTAGRKLVESKFCLQVTAPRLIALLQRAAESQAR